MPVSIAARSILRTVARSSTRQAFVALVPLRRTFVAPRTVPSSVRFFSATAQRRADAAAAEPEKEMDSGEQNIYDLLLKRFDPTDLAVEDVSGGCGSFYRIQIRSREFNGKPSIAQHRMVNDTLKEVISGIHGLQLKTYKVEE